MISERMNGVLFTPYPYSIKVVRKPESWHDYVWMEDMVDGYFEAVFQECWGDEELSPLYILYVDEDGRMKSSRPSLVINPKRLIDYITGVRKDDPGFLVGKVLVMRRDSTPLTGMEVYRIKAWLEARVFGKLLVKYKRGEL